MLRCTCCTKKQFYLCITIMLNEQEFFLEELFGFKYNSMLDIDSNIINKSPTIIIYVLVFHHFSWISRTIIHNLCIQSFRSATQH